MDDARVLFSGVAEVPEDAREMGASTCATPVSLVCTAPKSSPPSSVVLEDNDAEPECDLDIAYNMGQNYHDLDVAERRWSFLPRCRMWDAGFP